MLCSVVCGGRQVKNELASNETAKALEALERRLRHYEQNIFKLTEFIETKGPCHLQRLTR